MVGAFEDFDRRTASPGSGEFVNIVKKGSSRFPGLECSYFHLGYRDLDN